MVHDTVFIPGILGNQSIYLHGKENIMKRTARMILAALMILTILYGCASKGGDRDLVYDDMKADFEKTDLLSSNIGIVSRTANGCNLRYGEFGSGVVFERQESTCYALTAAHVVSDEDAQPLVFTTGMDLKTESIPGMEDLDLLSTEVYDSMIPARILYVSQKNDLAVISFETEEDLSVIEIADEDPKKGDRIMCVGNPENEWFAVSYGEILSGIESFGESTDHPSRAMKHSAYAQVGSSGGAAIGEDMKLIGITPGASLSMDGKSFRYGVMIPVSEILPALEEWRNK